MKMYNREGIQREEIHGFQPSAPRGEYGIPLMDYPYSSATPEPIINQPRAYQNDPESPATAPGKPPSDHYSPGLEHLNFVDHLLVAPIYEGFTLRRRYRITDDSGQDIYCAIRGSRPLKLLSEIMDNSGNQIIQMHLVSSCTCCGLPCTTDTVEVVSSSETLLGAIKAGCSFLRPVFFVQNSNRETVIRVDLHSRGCCEDVFKIMSIDGLVQLGEITREFAGCCSLNYKYRVTFPLDMEVPMKAVLLALCLWILQMARK